MDAGGTTSRRRTAASPGDLVSSVDPPTEQAIVERLVVLLVAASDGRLRPEMIDPGEHMYDCGYVDSLSAASFLQAVADEFGVRLKESQLVGRLDHVRALARHLREPV